MIRLLKSVSFFLSLLFFYSPVQAYDVDTHFYATYAMARYAGMKHSIAAKLATSAQWMDESYISDPTSMMFLPISGIKKRRLLHFPGSRVTGSLNAKAQQGVIEEYKSDFTSFAESSLLKALQLYSGVEVNIDGLSFISEVEVAHPFATTMLMEGLQEGNLMKAGASLHILEDSFAHAGTPAEEGHRSFWHWPDRPFDKDSIPKYWKMVDFTFLALVAIRNQLPPQALDCTYRNLQGAHVLSAKPNCEASAKELASGYKGLSVFKNAVEKNILKDAEYIRAALTYITELAIDVGYLKIKKEAAGRLINGLNIQDNDDAFVTFSNLLETWMTQIPPYGSQTRRCATHICLHETCDLQICSMLKDMGQISCEDESLTDYINSSAPVNTENTARRCVDRLTLREFAQNTTYSLLRWHVPIPLDAEHRIEFENDASPVRAKEMEIRIRNMRLAIQQTFDIDVEFLPNKTANAVGFWKEFYGDPSAEVELPESDKGTVYVTFNLVEKQQWGVMIFNYLFPSLKKDDLESLLQVGASFRNMLEQDQKFFKDAKGLLTGKTDPNQTVGTIVVQNLWNLANRPAEYKQIMQLLSPISANFLSDLFLSRVIPKAESTYYANPNVLMKYQKDWPKFLQVNDVWSESDLEFNVPGAN